MSNLTFYNVKSGGQEFYVSKLREKDRDTITFGGKKKCVVINVERDDSSAYMSIAQFDNQCNLNGDMRRKVGTIYMIKVAMKVTCQLYSHLSGAFKFDDRSSIPCKDYIFIRLPHYYWALHGKTWYEKHLKAYPVGSKNMDSQAIKTEYKEAVTTLKKELSTKPDLSQYIQWMKPAKKRYLQNVYENAKSMKEFIVDFKRQGLDCNIYETWLSQVVSPWMLSFENILWQMDCDHSIVIDSLTCLKDQPKDMYMVGGYYGITYMLKGKR